MIIEKKKKIFDKLKIFEFKEKNKLWLTSKKLTLATTNHKKRKSSKIRLQFLLIFYLTINIGAL